MLHFILSASLLFTLTLNSALADHKLHAVEVTAKKEPSDLTSLATAGGNAADLLTNADGLYLQTGGGLSSVPVIHGMEGDRVNIKIDGAQITSSCPNHMNPTLSYIDPTKVASIESIAGITPVSQGGDSIGGSIIVKTKDPEFAGEDESVKQKLKLSTFFKSNNENRGAAVHYGIATKKLSLEYAGLDEKANNYRSGDGTRIKSTLYNQNNQSLIVGHKLNDGLVSLKLSRAVVPYQGFVNQYMDLNDNVSNSGNLTYKGHIGAAYIESNIFHQHTNHYMNMLQSQRAGRMPMYTRSDESGYNIKASFELNKNHLLKVGSDYDRYRLDDWWPAVPASMMMGPNQYDSINNGQRDRLGLFVEADSVWSADLTSNIGLRTDIVSMDTRNVQGYNSTNNLPADQASFNNKSKDKRDHNYDATLLTNYKLNEKAELEFGLARKTRSPNLYERYAWAGTATDPATSGAARMDTRMINWVGDGNGYIGNTNLKPEVAHTLSTSLLLHNKDSKDWKIKVTPYYTDVKNFIDVDLVSTSGGVNYLKFANHDAVIFGLDLSADAKILQTQNMGDLALSFKGSYTRGYRKDGMTDLYHLMPLNGKVTLAHSINKWNSDLTVHLVNSKKQISKLRLEPETAGYALIDLGTSYQATKLIKVDLRVTNILDHQYGQPLGGINLVNNTGASHTPVAGVGRSINTAVVIDFF